ncbi:cell division protein FtsB [Geothermobacter ehrlichii]|uniref:Cell division protein FtsB n=1 Tax=Geothermobacter ehrlichii TaxID=213224 RepID=A0A5D3WI00_9BACT|nr:septum formation initiator family protein [Geothermobacter ehrlichii]TYO95689.1 cell division protein FtsB [Geothermobacter ehrlichii]
MAGEQVRKERWRFPAWWLVPLLLFLGFAFFGENGVVHMFKRYRQKQQLQVEVARLQRENDRLRREIDALKNDWRYIEAIARQKLGMVRKDEIIYQFPQAEKGSRGKTSASGPAPLP